MNKIFKKFIGKAFDIGILVKAVFGFFEILGGVLFVFSSKVITDNFIIRIAQEEIAQDPNDKDIIANYLVKTAGSLSQDGRIFAVAYLFFHGAVNILLAVSLAKEKAKTYPTIMSLLSIFIIYQIYKYLHTYSPALLFLIFFDIFFVGIVWLEYKKHKKI